MICACTDSFILKDGVAHLAAGAIAAQYQSMGGSVFWHGKPEASVFEYCVSGFDVQDKSRVAVVGDSAVSDIHGANMAGLDALFVAGGIHAKELGVSRGQQPDAERVSELLARHECTARAVLPAFVW